MSQAAHVTREDVLEDLGFDRPEAMALKVKAEIVEALLAEIARRELTQRQLVEMLNEYQPNVSNLLNGRISKISIEKLLRYAACLRMTSSMVLRPTVKGQAQRGAGTNAQERHVCV